MYIYLFGVWEPDLTAFVRRRLEPGDTFIDVGANVGYFALVAAERVGEGGRVAAVEASPRIHERLAAAIDANGLRSRVRAALCAAAGERGTLTVYAGPAHNVGLTTTVASRGLEREAQVEAAPLDEILEDDEIAGARLVKIDVEGGEPEVLAGMGAFLDRARDDVEILVELSPLWWADAERPPEEVLAPLRERGFHAYAIDNNYWPWRYLWPAAVRPPRRVRQPLTKRVKRYDLVLSRVDADEL
jgi:FkbM family methyltransferase